MNVDKKVPDIRQNDENEIIWINVLLLQKRKSIINPPDAVMNKKSYDASVRQH